MRRANGAAVVSAFVVALVLTAHGQSVPPPAAGPAPEGAPAAAPKPSPPPPPSPAAIERAERVLAAAREALGGTALANVKTVVAEGRTRRLRGNNIQPIEFEISIELPDKYLRKDEFPAEESEPVATGFNGATLIQPPSPAAPPGAAARPGGPPPAAARPGGPAPGRPGGPPGGGAGAAVKQDFARLALGLFAASFPAYPLTFGYVAQAEAPQGKADVLEARGDGNLVMRLFVHAETHLPIMVSWQLPPTNVVVTAPGQPPPQTVAPGAVVVTAPAAPPATATQAEKDKYAKDILALRAKAQATPVEHRLYYADYRDVDGVKFPFRLRRAIGADTTEETTFDRFRLNTRIDPRKFAVASK